MQFAKRLEKIPICLLRLVANGMKWLLRSWHHQHGRGWSRSTYSSSYSPRQCMRRLTLRRTTIHPTKARKISEAAVKWMERGLEWGWTPYWGSLFHRLKEAIHNTFLAFVEAGDYSDSRSRLPCIAPPRFCWWWVSHYAVTIRAWLFTDLDAIPTEVARQAKLLWINYPNNPTGALATLVFWVVYCQQYDILLCHDHAYSEMAWRTNHQCAASPWRSGCGDWVSQSVVTTWPAGGLVLGGSAYAIKGLGQVTNVDSGVFKAIQRAAIACLFHRRRTSPWCRFTRIVETSSLKDCNLWVGRLNLPATLYVWAPVPQGYSSAEFVTLL